MKHLWMLAIGALLAVECSAALSVNNSGGATNITSTSAWINVAVASTGAANPGVKAYWSSTNSSSNLTWQFTNDFGACTVATYTVQATLLSPNTLYYYRARGTNGTETNWSAYSSMFRTLQAPTTAPPSSVQNVTVDTNDNLKHPTNFFGQNTNLLYGALGGYPVTNIVLGTNAGQAYPGDDGGRVSNRVTLLEGSMNALQVQVTTNFGMQNDTSGRVNTVQGDLATVSNRTDALMGKTNAWDQAITNIDVTEGNSNVFHYLINTNSPGSTNWRYGVVAVRTNYDAEGAGASAAAALSNAVSSKLLTNISVAVDGVTVNAASNANNMVYLEIRTNFDYLGAATAASNALEWKKVDRTGDTNALDFTATLMTIAPSGASNNPVTRKELNDAVDSLGELTLYGATNVHATITGAASLKRETPAEWIITNTIAKDTITNVGTFFLTNTTTRARHGQYIGRFYARRTSGSGSVNGYIQLVYSTNNGVTTNTLGDLSRPSGAIGGALTSYRITATAPESVTNPALWLGVRYYLTNSGGGASTTIETLGGAPYDTHLATPGVGDVSGYVTVEVDPVWSAVASSITEQAGHGETAYGWGDHASGGYFEPSGTSVLNTAYYITNVGSIYATNGVFHGSLTVGGVAVATGTPVYAETSATQAVVNLSTGTYDYATRRLSIPVGLSVSNGGSTYVETNTEGFAVCVNGADNLGNHTAASNLNVNGLDINNVRDIYSTGTVSITTLNNDAKHINVNACSLDNVSDIEFDLADVSIGNGAYILGGNVDATAIGRNAGACTSSVALGMGVVNSMINSTLVKGLLRTTNGLNIEAGNANFGNAAATNIGTLSAVTGTFSGALTVGGVAVATGTPVYAETSATQLLFNATTSSLAGRVLSLPFGCSVVEGGAVGCATNAGGFELTVRAPGEVAYGWTNGSALRGDWGADISGRVATAEAGTNDLNSRLKTTEASTNDLNVRLKTAEASTNDLNTRTKSLEAKTTVHKTFATQTTNSVNITITGVGFTPSGVMITAGFNDAVTLGMSVGYVDGSGAMSAQEVGLKNVNYQTRCAALHAASAAPYWSVIWSSYNTNGAVFTQNGTTNGITNNIIMDFLFYP